MTNISGSQPIKGREPSASISTKTRIYNEASELYSRLRTVGENFTRWEEPTGRHHLLKLENNQLVYTVINQNVEPQQAKRVVYQCKFGKSGELEGITGKEYLHFKGEPKATVTMNTGLSIQLDGFAERVYGKSGKTLPWLKSGKNISWQDVVQDGLPQIQQQTPPTETPSTQAPPPQTPPAQTPPPPQTPPETEKKEIEFQTISGKFPARGMALSEGWYSYAINIPKGWVKDDDFNNQGFDVHPPNDPLTGFKFYNNPEGYTADEVVQKYIENNLKGAADIKVIDKIGKQEGAVYKSGKIITFTYNGKKYKSVIQAQVMDPNSGMNPLSYRVPCMPLQSAFNPLLAPNPYLIQQLKESILKTLVVKTTPVEDEETNVKIFQEIEKSFNPTYGVPSSAPPPQKVIVEVKKDEE